MFVGKGIVNDCWIVYMFEIVSVFGMCYGYRIVKDRDYVWDNMGTGLLVVSAYYTYTCENASCNIKSSKC